MTGKFQAWMADPRERRRAMIISAACILLVLLVAAMQILAPQKNSGVQAQPEAAKFTIPPRPKEEPVRPALPEAARLPAKRPAVITPATPVKGATPAKSPRHIKSARHVKKWNYYVQIGAFRGRKHAQAYMKRMQKLGWALSVHQKKNNMYGVWVGPWTSSALAKIAKKKLESQNIKGYTVKKIAGQ